MNPGLAAAALEKVGPIGGSFPGVKWLIGACAEFDAANQAMNAGEELGGLEFGSASQGGFPRPFATSKSSLFCVLGCHFGEAQLPVWLNLWCQL